MEGGLTEKASIYSPHYFSLLSSRSILKNETRYFFGNIFNHTIPSTGKLVPSSSIGAARSFSSSTKFPINRFGIAPQSIQPNIIYPVIRSKISVRNASSSGKSPKDEKATMAEKSKSKDSSPYAHPDANAELHNNKIQEFMDSTVSTVRTNVGSAEATIKRAVEELSTGDLLSVYGILLFIVVIAVGPSMIQRMRASDGDGSQYNVIDPEDPVMDLARMIRAEYLESIKRSMGNNEENEDEEKADDDEKRTGGRTSAMGLDRIIADLLKSPQIQEAATSLVTKIIQSSQFKTACQLLLKELLKDLLEDPDTLKQVIHLLQNAIVDEKIKEAAVQLATDIFGDERVLDELVILVQRLGMEQQVKYATQALLVESAHNALNDPEILDHSMEFATDVVGDDVVQQTAGEALYNTMSYAFRPTLSVLLTLMGLGLIFVSVTAFRNVNQTPGEAVDRAFFNAVEKTAAQLLKIVLLPLDFLIACKDALVSIILFPFRMISSSVSRAGKLGKTLLESAQDWILWLIYLPAQFLSSLLSGSEQILKKAYTNLTDRLSRWWLALDTSIFDTLFLQLGRLFSGPVHRVKMQWIILNHQLSDKILWAENFGFQIAQDLLVKFEIALESLISESVYRVESLISRPVHEVKFRWMILNRHVSDRILVVEKFGERIMQRLLPAWDRAICRATDLQGRVANLSTSLQQEGNKYAVILPREYHALNRNLAALAILVEDWIERIAGIDFRSK